jgi:hypothetical protein
MPHFYNNLIGAVLSRYATRSLEPERLNLLDSCMIDSRVNVTQNIYKYCNRLDWPFRL